METCQLTLTGALGLVCIFYCKNNYRRLLSCGCTMPLRPASLGAGALGLEFQVCGIYGIFETFICTKPPFCIKYSNISNWILYPYPVKGSGKGKNKGNFLAFFRLIIGFSLFKTYANCFSQDFLIHTNRLVYTCVLCKIPGTAAHILYSVGSFPTQ